MEGCPRNICPKLLDLIPQGREWYHEENNNTDQEKKLELRLGPPGGYEEDRSAKKNTETRNNNIMKEQTEISSPSKNHLSPCNKANVSHISQKRYHL